MSWYVIRVVTGKEKKCKELIEKELELSNLGDKYSKLLIPSKKVMQMRNGKKYAVEKNDFPGYILIETNFVDQLNSTIKNTSNVLGFLGTNDKSSVKPQPLRQKEVERIIGRQKENYEVEDKYFVGEIVSIVDGPFSSFVGVVTYVDDKKKTVKVDVKIFGREVPVDLTYLQIEKS